MAHNRIPKRNFCATKLAATWLLAGCSSDGSSQSLPAAHEIQITGPDAVPAAQVEVALSTLWPLLGRTDALEFSRNQHGQDISRLDGELKALTGGTIVLEPAGPELSVAEAFSQLAAANQALVASNQALVSSVNQLSEQNELLQSALDSLEAKVQAHEAAVAGQQAAQQQQIAALEQQHSLPRFCPVDMLPISDGSCMEIEVREPDFFNQAMDTCINANRRICTTHEVYTACIREENQELLGETGVHELLHWAGDSASRLKSAGGDGWVLSALAFGGRNKLGFSTCATEVAEAGFTTKGEDTPTASFHFRCCLDRL